MNEIENVERIGHAMMLAWGRIKRTRDRMWGEWMTIGEGLLEGRRWAMRQAGTNRPEGRGYVVAYAEWLKRYKVDDIDKSDRAKLLQLMEERAAVEEWRSTLTDGERHNLNNPTIAWRKWTAATRIQKPRPRTAGISASEAGRARSTIEELQARVEELEQELEAAEPRRRYDAALGEFLEGLPKVRRGLLSALENLNVSFNEWPEIPAAQSRALDERLSKLYQELECLSDDADEAAKGAASEADEPRDADAAAEDDDAIEPRDAKRVPKKAPRVVYQLDPVRPK
jgi:hypothetical protein